MKKKRVVRSKLKKEKRTPFWETIKNIQWKSVFSWLFRIPWRAIWRRARRLFVRRLLPACCFLLCLCILLGSGFLAVSAAVCDKTEDRIVTVEQLKALDVDFDCILVLGCRVHSDGSLSHMLEDRVATAVSLYQAGICGKLLMSGDSRSVNYDETGAMKIAAIEAGVPEEAILTDPAGLSTYDSIARLLQVYEGKKVVIVTQEYHLYRALYIAEKLGVEAYGVGADRRTYVGQFKYDVREVFARCKDVFYALTKPPAAEMSKQV